MVIFVNQEMKNNMLYNTNESLFKLQHEICQAFAFCQIEFFT